MKYVVYYRVSSKQQGQSGLGLEAQRTAVETYLKTHKAEEIPPSFKEVESGRNNHRPELRKAVNRCKETGSTLLIAKLDRLARNAAFIFTLKEELEAAKVGFIALDLPEANTLTLGIMAAMAQHEAENISARTKAGLKEAKRKGIKLGSPQNLTPEAREKARQANLTASRTHPEVIKAFDFIQWRRREGMSYAKIAAALNASGYRTREGKIFHASHVHRIYHRFTQNNRNHE
jgi:DNA invertase Pin-like site-specific DNA recombinase